jgi:hypothetical protein
MARFSAFIVARGLSSPPRSTVTVKPSPGIANVLYQFVVALCGEAKATGWLNLAYTGPPETTNCSANFHNWRLEIFENPSDHAPQLDSIARWIFPATGQALPSDRTQGAEDSRDQRSHVGRMTTMEAQTLAQQSSISAVTDFTIRGARRRGKFTP